MQLSSSLDANLSSILHKKSYFFYLTHLFLQNTHISLSILHVYSIKYSFFYNFLLFPPSLPSSLSLSDLTLPTITPHVATFITIQPASSRKTNPQNKKHKIDMVNLKGRHSKSKWKLQNPEERERERESFTEKLKPMPPLHHHNKPTPPTTKSKRSQKLKSKHNHHETHTHQT